MARFAVVPLASPLHDASSLATIEDRFSPLFSDLRGEWGEEAGQGIALPFVLTGGTEQQLIAHFSASPSDPLIVLAHPDQNSLPAALEGLARVRQLGGRGRIVYLDDGGRETGADLDAAVRGVEARRAMAAMRLGLIGDPSDWLVASSPDIDVVREVWGPTVVPIPVSRLIEATTAGGIGEAASSIWERATRVLVEPRLLRPASGVDSALGAIVASEHLTAVSVRCFDLIGALDTTGCIALSHLNDTGIVAGCEGDLPSTIAMVWVQQLLGAPSWMANPARVDRARGTILLAHCTVPRHLVTEYSLDSHFESGRGIGIAGSLATGPYTLLRIGGTGLDRLWLAEGTVHAAGDDPDPGLCRTQVEVDVGGEKVGELLDDPLGNHLVMVRGHHARALEQWHRLYV